MGTVAAALAVAVALAVGVESMGAVSQDLRYTRAAIEVSFWGRAQYRPVPSVVASTVAEIDALNAARPEHPDFLALAASADAWRGYFSLDRGAAAAHLGSALARQRAALARRPAWRHGWAQLGRYAQLAGQEDIVAEAAASSARLVNR
jgi:hypothetical protein